MKILKLVLLLAFSTLCQAFTVYKSVDEHGNIIFSDKPHSNTKSTVKIELNDSFKAEVKPSQHQLDSLAQENKATHERLAKEQRLLANIELKVKQDSAALQVAQQAMQQAYINWQEVVKGLQRGGSDYQQKRALSLKHVYEQAKEDYIKAQQDLAKSLSERTSLR